MNFGIGSAFSNGPRSTFSEGPGPGPGPGPLYKLCHLKGMILNQFLTIKPFFCFSEILSTILLHLIFLFNLFFFLHLLIKFSVYRFTLFLSFPVIRGFVKLNCNPLFPGKKLMD